MAAIVMIHNQLRKKRSQQTQRLHLPVQDTHLFSYLHQTIVWLQCGSSDKQVTTNDSHTSSTKKKGYSWHAFPLIEVNLQGTVTLLIVNCVAGEREIVFTFRCIQTALILTCSYSKLWPKPSMVYKKFDLQSHCFRSTVFAGEFIGRKDIWQE